MTSVVKFEKLSLTKFSIMLASLILALAAAVATAVMAEDAIESTNSTPANSPPFVATTNDDLISVKANEAPLKDVIKRIGQELGIEVDAQIGDEDKVNVEFQDLPLEAALKRLSGNYA